ncbi:alpha/beta hydrolase [Brevibacillus marinus]|uniref:alpha/beta hydrolase n=1 Tax=Brevibacillus marinus TaxID=2496837 RepID=UPI000F8420DF|nr:alpha/beta hydrolase [Brevibacillus marinus]
MAEKLSYYEYRATTLFACQYDQRFSYYAYVPKNYDENGSLTYSLAVIVHGTARTAQQYRDAFADFAEATNTIILAPLFPAGITAPRELSSYKFVQFGGIRFDHVLLAMIEELAEKYRIAKDKFLLHGFSGGGQFAHRFFYLHPDRLLGVSIGAPGYITYLDRCKPWYVGVADFAEQFGRELSIEQMRRVPVQLVIGSEDVDTWEINDHDSPFWMEGIDAFGKTRLERLSALRDNYEREGIQVRYDVVPGVAHEGFKVLAAVKAFFSDILATQHREGRNP